MTTAEYSKPNFERNVLWFALRFFDEAVTMSEHAQLMAMLVLNRQKFRFSGYKAFFFESQSDRLVSQPRNEHSSNFQERLFELRIFQVKIVQNVPEICPL